MRIAIIGFGAAAIGIMERLKESQHEIHVFEKSADIYSSSISGIRADGKLFVSSEMGGDITIDTALQRKLVDYYINFTEKKNVETGTSFGSSRFYKVFYDRGFLPVTSEFFHIGTDQLKEVLFNIYTHLSGVKNIHFHFNSTVSSIKIEKEGVLLNGTEHFDMVVVTVGRSGHKLINRLIEDYPYLVKNNTKVDLGIRFELPNHIVEELNHEMYEFKVKYKSRTGYMVRTFCNNPSGFVVTENYDDFTTVNGHAKLHEKSSNTNFAILASLILTEPFNDPIGYGSNIAKLSNLLAGEGKVILQTYSHFKESKRTKNLYRVSPTLAADKFILGDINLAYPRRIIESIIDFIENLNTVIPGVANNDNLVYAPEIKFYSNRLNNLANPFIKFAGDCSGATRSIIYATAHGYMMGEAILNNNFSTLES
ncbi:MAG TPA: hypothetical protein PK946_09510 [Tenuifilaceae bacterium]|nr:hypothetical protein [Tenuifilaceae bacterium]